MNELDFLRGIEGETQQGSDLVAGAEHLVRLKQQTGQSEQPRYPDLELAKEASSWGGGESREYVRRHNAYADEFNQPDNVSKANALLEHHGQRLFKKPLAQLNEQEWGTAYEHVMNDPHFRSMSDRHFGSPAMTKKAADYAKLKQLLQRVDPALLVTMGLGAAAGGIGTYLGSRPQKDSGKSKMEEEMEGRVKAHQSSPDRGLMDKMHGTDLEHAHGYAKAFRDHPGKAGLLGAITGGIGGYTLGRLGGAVIRGGK